MSSTKNQRFWGLIPWIGFMITVSLCQKVKAQTPEELELQGDYRGASHHYVASKQIHAKSVFKFTAESDNTFVARLGEREVLENLGGMINSPDPSNPPADQGSPGATLSSYSVAPNGDFIYEIPITVTPGTNNMTPQIGISYHSSALDGIMGMGFNLTGLSSITRGPATHLHDNELRDPVDFDDNDRLLMDGERLVIHSGSYGADAAEYRLENNRMAKIIGDESINGNSPSFKVWDRSGLIKYYGTSNQHRVGEAGKTHTWLLSKVEDRFGNYMTVIYDRSDNQFLPSRIDYTGNDNLVAPQSTFASIEFIYEERPSNTIAAFNPLTFFIEGHENAIHKRLKRIINRHESTIFREYVLDYATSDTNVDYGSYLIAVTEYGQGGESAGPNFTPITFEWSAGYTGLLPESQSTVQLSERLLTEFADPTYTNPQTTIQEKQLVGDFTGNGQSDMLYIQEYTVQVDRLDATTGELVGNESLPVDNKATLVEQRAGAFHFLNSFTVEEDLAYDVGDFNGDSQSDVLIVKPDDSYEVLSFNGSHFLPLFQGTLPSNTGYDVGDFNGDGLMDIGIYQGSITSRTLTFLENTGSQFTNSNETTNVFSGTPLIADFNGDGATDLALPTVGGITYLRMEKSNFGIFQELFFNKSNLPPFENNVIFGDFNGDGVMDIMEGNGDFNGDGEFEPIETELAGHSGTGFGEYVMFLGTGNGFKRKPMRVDISSILWVPGATPQFFEYKFHAGDINGDQKSDLVVRYADPSNTVRVYLNVGDAFELVDSFTMSNDHLVNADFTGNGISDFLELSPVTDVLTTSPDHLSFEMDFTLHADYHQKPFAVRKVTNSLYSPVLIDYKPLTDNEVYTQYSDATGPLIDVVFPQQVVSDLYVDDGIGGIAHTRYHYEGAKVHTRGRGFMGFQKVTSEDLRQGLLNTKIFSWNTTDYVSLLSQESTYSLFLFQTLSEISIDYKDIYDVNPRTYLYAKDLEIATTYDPLTGVKLSEITSNYGTYDHFGNLEGLTQSHLSGHSTTISNQYKTPDEANWIVDRLESATVDNFSPLGLHEIRHSEFTYDANGYLKTETIEPGHALELKKDYYYDQWGNIEQTDVTGSGATRSDYSFYRADEKGRFPYRTRNAKNQETDFQYDLTKGLVTKSIDANSQQTDFSYDNFGRILSVTPADGVATSTSYHWNDTNGPSQGIMYVEIAQQGGNTSRAYTDRLGRTLREGQKNRTGTFVYVDTQYNKRGLTGRTSLPFFAGENPTWSTLRYDAVGRLIESIAPGGRRTTTTYEAALGTMNSIVINPLGQKNERIVDDMGRLILTEDNAGTQLKFTYTPTGASRSIQVVGNSGTLISMGYDVLRNQQYMDDPDLGRTDFVYNAFGEMISQTSGRAITTTFAYDELGRMTNRDINAGEHLTTWTYDLDWVGTVTSISTAANKYVVQSYHYEPTYGRLEKVDETIDGILFSTEYTYDTQGRIDELTYPSGFKIKQRYNTFTGQLERVTNIANSYTYWEAQSENARGQLTAYQQGGILNTSMDFNAATGYLQEIKTVHGSSLKHHQSFQFDAIGNLAARTDHRIPGKLMEDFQYDGLNRLTQVDILNKAYGSLTMDYDALGNLIYKSDVGTYTYDGTTNGGPHAIASIDPTTAVGISRLRSYDQDIVYTGFDKVATITDEFSATETRELSFHYGTDLLRKLTIEKVDNVIQQTKYFVGGFYEEEVPGDGSDTRKLHYIMTDGGATAIYTEEGVNSSTHFLLKDHLGSISAISDEAGNILERYSYDAWGNRRNPDTWELIDLDDPETFDRGFTGHEHLDRLALINMNGRVYDPILGRFLSADPFTQFPEYTQGLNRYTYVLNNPLSFTDPSGYNVSTGQIAGTTITLLTMKFLGPFGSAFLGTFTGALIDGADVNMAFEAGVRNGLSAFAQARFSTGVGQAFGDQGSVGVELARASMHGLTQGLARYAFGGRYRDGFVSGFFSSLAGSAGQQWGDQVGFLAATVAGGASEAFAGGNFADGALTGAYVYLFNHLENKFKSNLAEEFSTVLGRIVFPDGSVILLSYSTKTEIGKILIQTGANGDYVLSQWSPENGPLGIPNIIPRNTYLGIGASISQLNNYSGFEIIIGDKLTEFAAELGKEHLAQVLGSYTDIVLNSFKTGKSLIYIGNSQSGVSGNTLYNFRRFRIQGTHPINDTNIIYTFDIDYWTPK